MIKALFSGLWFLLSPSPIAATGLEFVPPEQLRGIPLAELPYAGYRLPAQVDLSEHMPPPGFQSQQNSCVAWVSAYAVKTYQEKIEQRYQLIARGQPDWKRIFSPAFVYNQINQGRDGGATLVDALNLLSSRGALSWSEMPYNPDDYQRLPSASQLEQARRYRIAYWRQVNVAAPMELKSHLQAGYPIMIGAMIDDGLYRLGNQEVWKQPGGQSLGGHALVLVGYDDHKQAFKVLNSWGPKWSSQGYGWISYGHFAKVVREGYVAKDALTDPWPTLSSTPAVPPRIVGSAPGVPAKPQPVTTLQPSADAVPPVGDNRSKEDLPATSGASHSDAEKKESREQIADERDLKPASALDGIVNGSIDDLDDMNNIERPLMQAEEEYMPAIQILSARLLGDQVLFAGQWDLAPQAGKQMQVVIQLYRDAAGKVPLNSDLPRYALANGQAVAVSITLPVDDQAEWLASIPARLLTEQLSSKTRAKVKLGLIELWAQPVLYLDRFGVERGPLQRIELKP